MQHEDVVGQRHHEAHVMLDDDHREVRADELAELLLQSVRLAVIEPAAGSSSISTLGPSMVARAISRSFWLP